MNISLITPQRVTSVFLAAMVSVFLLLVGPGGYTDISRFKHLLFLILCAGYLFAMVVSFFIYRKKNGVFPRVRFKAVHWLLLLFLLFTAVSAVVSPYFPDTMWGFHRREGLLTVFCYVFCFFGVSLFGEVKPWLLWLFGVAITLFCIVCFLQFLGLNPLWLYPEGLNYYDAYDAYRYEFLGTVGNVGLVAAVLGIAAPSFVVALVRCREKCRFWLLIPLASVLAVTVLSKVAAAYVAVFGGLLLLIPLAMVRTRRKKILILLLICCLLLAAFACLFFVDAGNGTLHEIHVLLHGGWDDDFGTGRLFIWRNVLSLVPERPFFGGGCDTLGLRMTVEFERYDVEKGITYRASIDTAHNEYLNILVNEGALALAAYLGALLWSFVVFLRKNAEDSAVAICGAAVLGYCIQAFFGIRMSITAPFFWIFWALMWAALRERDFSGKFWK